MFFAFALLAAIPRCFAENHVLLVAGHGGEENYTTQFAESLGAIQDALIESHGYDADRVHLIAEPDNGLDAILSAFTSIANASTAEDTFLLILMGHGQSDYQTAKFNLPGKDLDAKTLSDALDALPMQDRRLILSFPCSGHFSELLEVQDAAVLASTDGPRQIYHSEAHRYLLKAFSDDWTDEDGDGKVTLYELFRYVSLAVDEFFASQEFMQTENVSLEDNGDGNLSTLAADMDAGDGERSRAAVIWPAPGSGKGER